MCNEVNVLQVTWKRAFEVWWSITWRVLVISSITTGVFGVSSSSIKTEGNIGLFEILLYILGIGLNIVISVMIVQAVLQQKFSDFKIVLMKLTKDDQPTLVDRCKGMIGLEE